MHCRLCESDRLRLYYSQGADEKFNFFRCDNCGLVNLDLTGIDSATAQEKYSDDFRDPENPSENPGAASSHEFLINRLKPGGKFLDVGCGNGALLYLMRSSGFEVAGIEISPKLAERVKSNLGVEVLPARFPDEIGFDEKFDVVALRHVLEHIPDSVKAMRTISSRLRSGGYALFEFPNIADPAFRFKIALERFGVRKRKRRDTNYVPGHCNEFSRKSFAYLCGITGFDIVTTQTYSFNPVKNKLYKALRIGSKLRALTRKRP